MTQANQADIQKKSVATYAKPEQANDESPAGGRPSVVQLLNLSTLEGGANPQPEHAIKPAGGSANPLHSIKTRLTICVGSAEVSVGELLEAREQQVLRLDQTIDQAVDIMLEGQVVARGVLVAVDDYFGVRITELPVSLSA